MIIIFDVAVFTDWHLESFGVAPGDGTDEDEMVIRCRCARYEEVQARWLDDGLTVFCDCVKKLIVFECKMALNATVGADDGLGDFGFFA